MLFRSIAFVRYADDLLLFSRTWDEAEKAKALLEDYLEKELSLRLNGEKTHILSAGEIGYLGYSFRKYGNRYALSLDDDVRKKMRCRMEAHIKRKSDTAEMLDRIGAFNRGWLEYYGKAHPTDLIPFIHEVQSRELKLITNKIDCMSGTDQDAMRLILSTKGYVTLSEWYDELRERGVCYDEELR